MASSAGGGADDGGRRSSPPAAAPAPPRTLQLVDDLIDVRERATMLQTMLLPQQQQGSPPTPRCASVAPPEGTSELIERIMSRLSSALSTLDTTAIGGRQGQGRRRRKKATVAESGSGSGPQRRSSTRRRSHSPFVETITVSTLDDGKSWRKYGQKHIQDSPNNPRSYYRCTHKPDQGCRATRQVQASDANPSEFVISYYGQHTCREPSTIPLVIVQDTTSPPPDCANLISFAASSTTTTSTHTASLVPPHPHQAAFVDPSSTTMAFSRLVGGYYSSSLPAPAHHQADYRCGSEEVHSSSSPATELLAAVVGSAGTKAATVGSAPAEYWPGGAAGASDMACGPGTGSFPSSPSSLGFMTDSFGSFGNAGDDDLFGFDP